MGGGGGGGTLMNCLLKGQTVGDLIRLVSVTSELNLTCTVTDLGPALRQTQEAVHKFNYPAASLISS